MYTIKNKILGILTKRTNYLYVYLKFKISSIRNVDVHY